MISGYKGFFPGLVICLFIMASAICNDRYGQLTPCEHYSTDNNLSDNGVTSILEDSRGYIWVGTYDGLNRLDGYDIKVYQNGLNDDILASNRVRSILEDDNGNLWIGTEDGITLYNYLHDNFTLLYSNRQTDPNMSGPLIQGLYKDKDNVIYGISNNMHIYIFKNDILHEKIIADTQSLKPRFCDATFIDDTTLILVENAWIQLFNTRKRTFKRAFTQYAGSNFYSIETDRINTVYIGTMHDLLAFNYSKVNGEFSFSLCNTMNFGEDHQTDNWSYVPHKITLDSLGNLWVSTQARGLFHMDNAQNFKHNKDITLSRFGKDNQRLRIGTVATDLSHGCLVGTFDLGLYCFTSEKNPFYNYTTDMKLEHGIQSNMVKAIIPVNPDKALIFAVGVDPGFYNTIEHKFEKFPFSVRPDPSGYIGTGYIDSRENTWLYWNANVPAIYRFHKKESSPNRISHVTHPNFNSYTTKVMEEDMYGNLWCGDIYGLYRVLMDADNNIKSVESFSDNNYFKRVEPNPVWDIYCDSIYHFMWVGTEREGLLRFNLSKNADADKLEMTQYKKLPLSKKGISSNFITCIVGLPDSSLWLSTEGGGICNVLNRNTSPHFQAYSISDGLSSNNAKSIQYDNAGSLWISTNKGLNRFHLESKSFRHFKKEDGMHISNFQPGSARLQNGNLFFGSHNGFCYFNPATIPISDQIPKILFRDLYIHNKKVYPGDTINNRVIINKPLAELESIVLNYNQNVFTIEAMALHYGNPKNHFLRYKLSPIDKDWIITTSDKNGIKYNGLPPGKYNLQVCASNTNMKWSDAIVLKIVIKPPFWKTWWAVLTYFIITGALIILSFYWRTIQIRKRNIELAKEVRSRTREIANKNNILRNQAEELNIINTTLEERQQQIEEQTEELRAQRDELAEVNSFKDRLFSIVAHDLKNPFSTLAGFLEILRVKYHKYSEEKRIEMLDYAIISVHSIQSLLVGLLTWARSQSGTIKIDKEQVNLLIIIQENIALVKDQAKRKHISLTIDAPSENIYAFIDSDIINTVIRNLLTNAIKFTPPKGKIIVQCSDNKESVTFAVKDSGVGISDNDIDKLFRKDVHYTTHGTENEKGTGLGLITCKDFIELHDGTIDVESVIGKGTTFSVNIPK